MVSVVLGNVEIVIRKRKEIEETEESVSQTTNKSAAVAWKATASLLFM
jgi:hypothetical protein